MTKNVCFSGGALPYKGYESADLVFGECAKASGHVVIHFTFQDHRDFKHSNGDYLMLNQGELDLAHSPLLECKKVIGRKYPTSSSHTDNLLKRNWHQVRDTYSIFAFPECIQENDVVSGGTAWAVHMGILKKVPKVYVYDQKKGYWFKWCYQHECWERHERPPTPWKNYTGIGTRKLTPDGAAEIRALYGLTTTF